MFGLLLDKEVCYQNLRDVVKKRPKKIISIRIDMEDSSCVDREFELFRKLKAEFPRPRWNCSSGLSETTLNDLHNLLDPMMNSTR
jgi:proline dehydrogenase